MPEEAEDIGFSALGRTLVSADGTPLGFSAVYFKPNGKGEAVAIVVFWGGHNQFFMRKYLPMALRGMFECIRQLLDMGVCHVYCVCDRNIPNSDKLIQWFGGTLIEDAEDPAGSVFRIDFDKMKHLPERNS